MGKELCLALQITQENDTDTVPVLTELTLLHAQPILHD